MPLELSREKTNLRNRLFKNVFGNTLNLDVSHKSQKSVLN